MRNKLKYKYHPNRYYLTHDFAKPALNIYRQDVGTSLPTMNIFNKLMPIILKSYNSHLNEIPESSSSSRNNLINNSLSYFMHYAAFNLHGKNIFEFSPTLTEMFNNSVVDEVILSNIKYPYKAFYLHFGMLEEYNLWDEGYFVDGAYITQRMDMHVEILLSTVRQDIDYEKIVNPFLVPDRYYYLPVEYDLKSKVSDSLEKAIDKDLKKRNFDRFDSRVINLPDRNITLIDNQGAAEDERQKYIKNGYDIFVKSINLIINALCYISSYKSEIVESYPPDAPQSLIDKINNSKKPSEIKRTTSKLQSLGYTKIKLCGSEIQKSISIKDTGKSVKTHWRRGHWRNQAIGPRLSSNKLIWIKPTLVRPDKGNPEDGHIYSISKNA